MFATRIVTLLLVISLSTMEFLKLMNKETDIVIMENARKSGLSFAALLVVLGSIVGQMSTYLLGGANGHAFD